MAVSLRRRSVALVSRASVVAGRRRKQIRRAFLAGLAATLTAGYCAEAPAVDLFVKLRAHNNSKAETMTLEQLASLVDNLDKELQRQGRVTVKQPDVWGQNRLTTQRADYDKLIKLEQDNFNVILQGYKSELDNAGLAYEMRIRNSMARNANGVLSKPLEDTPNLTSNINVLVSSPSNGTFSGTNSNLPNFAFTKDNSNLTLANPNTANGIGLEPTIYIDEKSRYIQHIHQKLRNNMGDDKTDMPGYGLYLVRMPISILPGSNTMRDNGAVVTAEIKHNLTGDLLKQMMRGVVLREANFNMANLLRSFERDPKNPKFSIKTAPAPNITSQPSKLTSTSPRILLSQLESINKFLLSLEVDQVKLSEVDLENIKSSQIDVGALQINGSGKACISLGDKLLPLQIDSLPESSLDLIKQLKLKKSELDTELSKQSLTDRFSAKLPNVFNGLYYTNEDIQRLHQEWSGIDWSNNNSTISSGISMHEPDIYIWLNNELSETAHWLDMLMKNPTSGNSIKEAGRQIREAYRNGQLGLSMSSESSNDNNLGGFLTLDRARVNLFKHLILSINEPALTNALKTIFNEEAKLLEQFKLENTTSSVDTTKSIAKETNIPRLQIRNRFALAYTYFLYSSIVNEQLKADMKVMAERKGMVLEDTDLIDFDCFNPDDLAKSYFTDYIKAKWPIQVFSLDPEVDQQNEADALSRRTDMQVALAQAMATGAVDLTQALQYSRRIEQQFATIGLNRTAVGFSAAATTFGWKFYPRLQTPPPQSNPERVLSTIFQGSPSRRYDMSHRQMEPGTRECVALVVAPNFVPSIRMTTTTNWFDLTPIKHHGDERILNADMIRMGRQIQMARNAFQRLCDDGNYRPGDLERLQDRITQLENMLPTQTMDVQLPYEGDWYGMELFTSDGARLAPRLFMWYGEPAKPSTGVIKVDDKKVQTFEGVEQSVFVIGQGFSVTESKVIVGGIALPETEYQLISRNVMRVRIPKDAGIVDYGTKKAIDVHVATPNGVSNHLYIEVPKDSGAPNNAKTPSAASTPAKVSSFTMKSPPTIVYIDFDEADGSVKVANVENRNQYDVVIEDSTVRTLKEKPRTVTALRLDFLEKEKSVFNLAASFDAQEKVRFEESTARLGIEAVKLIESAIKEKSGIKKSTFQDKSKFVVKGSILVDEHALTIPLEGSFEVTLVANNAEGAPKAALNRLKNEAFDSIHSASSLSSVADASEARHQVESPVIRTKNDRNQGRSPFVAGNQRSNGADATRIERQRQFQNMIGQNASKTSETDLPVEKSDLPPALTPPADDLLERQSFVRSQPIRLSQSSSVVNDADRSGNALQKPKKSQAVSRYSAGQIDAAQKTGIPLPR